MRTLPLLAALAGVPIIASAARAETDLDFWLAQDTRPAIGVVCAAGPRPPG